MSTNNKQEQLDEIIEKYTEELVKLYGVTVNSTTDIFDSKQLEFFDKHTVHYIIIGLPYCAPIRQLTRTQKSFLPINMTPSKDGKIKKLQNIILKKIIQEIFNVQNSLIIILQSDRFLYVCQSASIESFKSCKIIKLNNNCDNSINEIANRIHFAEQQLAYDKSYDFAKQKFVQIWQQEIHKEPQENIEKENETTTKSQQIKRKVVIKKKIVKVVKKEKEKEKE